MTVWSWFHRTTLISEQSHPCPETHRGVHLPRTSRPASPSATGGLQRPSVSSDFIPVRMHIEEHRRLLLDAYYGALNSVPAFLELLSEFYASVESYIPLLSDEELVVDVTDVMRMDPRAE